MELAVAGLFRAKWTAEIHDEWIWNVLKNRSDLTEAQLHRTRDLMNAAVLDCLVEGYEELIPALTLPDADDRHVLAAAIKSGADAIVTFNRRDFPKAALENYDIELQDPDTFIQHQMGLDAAKVGDRGSECRARLKNPPATVEEYLERLEAQSLPLTVAELRPYSALL